MASGCREFVVVETGHQAFDDPHRVRHVGVEQHDRQPAVRGVRQQIGFADFAADRAGRSRGRPCRGRRGRRPRAARGRFDMHERQEVL